MYTIEDSIRDEMREEMREEVRKEVMSKMAYKMLMHGFTIGTTSRLVGLPLPEVETLQKELGLPHSSADPIPLQPPA